MIIQGPNPSDAPDQDAIASLEIVRARPSHFIKADGSLDLDRWEQTNVNENHEAENAALKAESAALKARNAELERRLENE